MQMKTKVLISVKTYPTLSSKYQELVCTAGFREDGRWIRIYPVPFRKLDYSAQYRKYDWIEMDLVKNDSDFRPESYRPVNIDVPPRIVGKVGTESGWYARKQIALKKIYADLNLLISEAKAKGVCTSLATFKPRRILDFISEPDGREWDKKKLAALSQLNLFEQGGKQFQVVRKLPYKFSYIFEDTSGKKSKLMIEEWEIGALYWNCLKKRGGNEKQALLDVKNKYLEEFTRKTDLYFFLGTTQQFHMVAPNPFIIIGTFRSPKQIQRELNI